MGAKLPIQVAKMSAIVMMLKHGLKRFSDPGKVSEGFILPDYPDNLLIFTTPRKSIYDFSLNCLARKTGEVTTAMTVFFYTQVLKGFKTHIIAYGSGIDKYLPEKLKNNHYLQKCALIVQKVEIAPVECIAREHFAGSIVAPVREHGAAFGYPIDHKTTLWAKLQYPIFTPTTKATDGHDKPISREEVSDKFGEIYEIRSLAEMEMLYEFCLEHGLILVDRKGEYSTIVNGDIILADKLGPDEARFIAKEEWENAMREGREPASLDKETLRKWGNSVVIPLKYSTTGLPVIGIKNLDPENEEHIAFVQSLPVPGEVIEAIVAGYLEIFRRLTGMELEEYQKKIMKISC